MKKRKMLLFSILSRHLQATLLSLLYYGLLLLFVRFIFPCFIAPLFLYTNTNTQSRTLAYIETVHFHWLHVRGYNKSYTQRQQTSFVAADSCWMRGLSTAFPPPFTPLLSWFIYICHILPLPSQILAQFKILSAYLIKSPACELVLKVGRTLIIYSGKGFPISLHFKLTACWISSLCLLSL